MKNKIIIASLILLIFALIGVSFCFLNIEKNRRSKNIPTADLKSDKRDEEGMDLITQQNPDPVKGIESFEGYKKTDENDSKYYEIKDIKSIKDDKTTTIKGLVKNNGGKERIIIKAEFYDLNNNVLGSSSIYENVKVNSSEYFEIKALNSVASDNYKVFVEYVGE